MKKIIVLICVLVSISSCKKDKEELKDSLPTGSGFYVVNEGNFTWGNATLGFVSDSFSYSDKVYENANNKQLGDVLQHFYEWGNNYYLVMNNSKKIEAIDKTTYKSIFTVKDLKNPRYMTVAGNNGYVNDLFTDEITVFDLSTGATMNTIKLGGKTSRIYRSGAWVLCKVNDKIYKIDSKAVQLTDSFDFGMKILDLSTDEDSMVFAVAQGEKDSTFVLQLDRISLGIKNKEYFPFLNAKPKFMRVTPNGVYIIKGTTLHYMEVIGNTLTTRTEIFNGMGNLYGFDVHPVTGDFYFCDAKDYASKGNVTITDSDLNFIKKLEVGIIPNGCYFVNE